MGAAEDAGLLVSYAWSGRSYRARRQDGQTFLAAVAAATGLTVPARRYAVSTCEAFLRQWIWLNAPRRGARPSPAEVRTAPWEALASA